MKRANFLFEKPEGWRGEVFFKSFRLSFIMHPSLALSFLPNWYRFWVVMAGPPSPSFSTGPHCFAAAWWSAPIRAQGGRTTLAASSPRLLMGRLLPGPSYLWAFINTAIITIGRPWRAAIVHTFRQPPQISRDRAISLPPHTLSRLPPLFIPFAVKVIRSGPIVLIFLDAYTQGEKREGVLLLLSHFYRRHTSFFQSFSTSLLIKGLLLQ